MQKKKECNLKFKGSQLVEKKKKKSQTPLYNFRFVSLWGIIYDQLRKKAKQNKKLTIVCLINLNYIPKR